VVLAGALFCSVAASPASAAGPTLLVATRTPVVGLTATSAGIDWRQYTANSGAACSGWILNRPWSTRKTTTVHRCPAGTSDDGGMFAAGSASAIWTREIIGAQGCCDVEFSMKLRTPTSGWLDSSFHQRGCGGDELASLVAHGSSAAYSRTLWTSTYCPGNPDPGTDSMTGGDVRILTLPTGAPSVLPGAPPAWGLALEDHLLAVVPFDVAAGTINHPPPPVPAIQIWNRDTQTIARTIHETGTIQAMAMSGDVVAVLVADSSGNLRIDCFSAGTGALERTLGVPGTTRPMLSVYYRFVVFSAGKAITTLDVTSGLTHVLATPTYGPQTLVTSHGQVVWYAARPPRGARIMDVPIQ
jgi:hypothetical protein